MSRWPDAPYKGLNYYSAADAPLFSRREDDIEEVVALLAGFDTRVVLLQGETGTGKSSFLRAGLVPRLQAMPPDEGRRYFFLRAADSDPLLIRTTDDPVARIYEALQSAATSESVSEGARAEIRRVLSSPIPPDRAMAIPAIMAALKALTAPPQRDVFLLLVDQAEEVLTLMSRPGVVNARAAFFALLEQICFHLADLRMIVALRTEWVGRFNAFLRIRPTNKLTSAAEPRAGLFDYLLPPMGERDIAAAIRHPTLATRPRDDDPSQVESVYRFTYDTGVPELIAADLAAQSREVSSLPTMQIVCKQLYDHVKDHLPATITEQNYIKIGRAAGAIDAFVDRALREAAAIAGLPPLAEPDLDRWMLVLAQVVGRSEGGTVQTLVASEDELLEEADNHGIAPEAARAMLSGLAHPDRRLLRVIGLDGGATGYSLGHDSLGASVLRRSAQAAAAAQADAAAERRIRNVRRRWALGAVLVPLVVFALIAAAATFWATTIAPLRERIEVINGYAAREQSSDYRLRLLLLAAAVQRAEASPGSMLFDVEPTKATLRAVLRRSPVFGGTFDAVAWDASGRHVIRFEDGKLIVHDLERGHDEATATLPPLEDGAGIPPSIGLITRPGGVLEAVAYRPDLGKLLAGGLSSRLEEKDVTLPDPGADVYIPRTDIFGNHVRLWYTRFSRNTAVAVSILQLSGGPAGGFVSADGGLAEIEWDPIRDQGLPQPVLAEDCDGYAFLSRGENNGVGYFVWHGDLRHLGGVRTERVGGEAIAFAGGAVTISRACGEVIALIRDDVGTALHLIPREPEGAPWDSVSLRHLQDVTNTITPAWAQAPPMLAAAPLSGGGGWRVGWPTARGLAVVDVARGRDPNERDCSKQPPGGTERKELGACLVAGAQLLTGTEPTYLMGSLSFSPDGMYAFMVQQQAYQQPLTVRAFNLNFAARARALEKLSTSELIREACRVVRFQNDELSNDRTQTRKDELTSVEMHAWLGDETLPQPCAGAS